MIKLQPCPNCGGKPKLRKKSRFGKVWYECDGDCWTQTDKYWDEQDARNEWNGLKPRIDKTPTAKSGYCPMCDEVIEVYSSHSMCYCPTCGHHVVLHED